MTTRTTPSPSTPHTPSDEQACRADPARFIIAALRLFACPCSAPVHDTLREDSPASHLLAVMKTIDAHARRPLRLNPGNCHDLTADEQAFVQLLGCAQAGRAAEMAVRCASLVRPEGQEKLRRAISALACKLQEDDILLAPPAHSAPPRSPRVLTPVDGRLRGAWAG